MFTIRPESPKDLTSIREVHLRAFEGEGEAKLVDAIRASDNFVPELSLVAVTGTDQVIGHILFSIVGIETDTGIVPTLALAPMAVLPEYQNRGIGSALVREGLRRSAELGFEHVVVLGHPNFYPRFGFVPSTTKGIRSPFKVRDEVFMVHEIQVGSLDHIHGTVKYPPAFDLV
ncbi:GNAT family N-acetyltransferase [Alicyclobacillus macrosporangiidus]|uniref:GNAT family N-acetyltransferase n=1 Tax=Alicyclobacillus macrosporangiidus TaxID=392015 RepID=UPI000495AD7E|nr:N-acetyltransferase [Alicyclobacillus macrosporangiidus]